MEECDYVIVGSGAGGAPWRRGLPKLACASWCWRRAAIRATVPACPRITTFAAFHPLASEHPAMRWDFFVQHYADEARQRRDCQAATGRHSVSAGRHAGWLHRAQRDDPDGAARFRLDDIAALTDIHRGARRRCGAISQRWRRAAIVRLWRALSRIGLDATGHGWNGWLPTECATPRQVNR